MEWKAWNKVPFSSRDYLPMTSGIYIIVDAKDVVWYVGQAKDIRKRWAGKGHHRYQQLLRTNKKRHYSIYWKSFPVDELTLWENKYISKLDPELNRSKVKRYIPSEPVKVREIRRIIKALTKTTHWHPKIRSVLVGKTISDDSIVKVFFAFHGFDIGIITRSTWSKKSPLIRKAWQMIRPNCGFDEEQYDAPFIYEFYLQEGLEIVFLQIEELLEFLGKNTNSYDLYVDEVDFLGVKVKALNSMDLFGEYKCSEIDASRRLIHKIVLSDFAYLNMFLDQIEVISKFEV